MIKIILKSKKESGSCPKATQDLKLNTKNRNSSIKAEHIQYGPLNLSDEDYWVRAAKHWNTTPEVAKKSKCGNCTAFDVSPRMLDCLPGSVSEPIEDKEGKLGYCWMHHFKCHSARTCYTWAAGGPISKDDVSYEWQKKNEQSVTEDSLRGFAMKKENLSRQDIEKVVREELTASIDEKKKKRKKKKKKKAKKRDACYHKVKSRYDVWPSAYASGALVKCRKVGAKNWGNKSKKKNEELDIDMLADQIAEEILGEEGLRDWFDDADGDGQGEWEQIGGKYDGKPCAKQPGQKTKPKCASPEKAASMTKKERDNAAKRKRAKDPNPNRKGKAKNVNTKPKKESIEEIEYKYIPAHEATYDDGNPIDFILEFWDDVIVEAEYQGRKVTLNKPMQGDVKKFKVYVKDPKTKNVKKVNFGDPNMRIKKSNPKRRKAFRDRHNCKEKMKKGDKTTAGYWSCKKW